MQNAKFQIGLKKFLWLKKLKILSWTYFISNINGEEIAGIFYEKKLQKARQKDFRVEKVIKRIDDKLYVNPNLG